MSMRELRVINNQVPVGPYLLDHVVLSLELDKRKMFLSSRNFSEILQDM